MLNVPKFIYKIKVALPNVYLWRCLGYALALFVAAIGAAVGVAPELARIVL